VHDLDPGEDVLLAGGSALAIALARAATPCRSVVFPLQRMHINSARRPAFSLIPDRKQQSAGMVVHARRQQATFSSRVCGVLSLSSFLAASMGILLDLLYILMM
jgi:hypothetical protein